MPCSELSVALKIRFTANPRGESTSGKRTKAPVYAAYVEVSCLVPRGDGYYSPGAISERSAARLAHQSGGLGVPSSNLGAPTNKTRHFSRFFSAAASQILPLGSRWEDEFGKGIIDMPQKDSQAPRR